MGCASPKSLPAEPTASSGAASGDASLAGFSFHDVLGAGSYGQVRSCTDNASGAELAVKIVHLRCKRSRLLSLQPQADGTSLATEEEILWRECCAHKNVLRLRQAFVTENFAFFIMDRCLCSLLDLLEQGLDEFDEEQVLAFFFQMLLAIEYVHSKEIVHRDIKPPNFLVSNSVGSTHGEMKLCDFGLALRKDDVARSVVKVAGSPVFIAPEMAFRRSYGCAVDIWSLGVTIYIITFGSFPFEDEARAKGVNFSEKFLFLKPSYAATDGFPQPSPEVVAFIQHLLEFDDDLRKTATQCLQLEPVRKFARRTLFSKLITFTGSSKDSSSQGTTSPHQSTGSHGPMARSTKRLRKQMTLDTLNSVATSVATHNDIDTVLKSVDPRTPSLDCDIWLITSDEKEDMITEYLSLKVPQSMLRGAAGARA